MVTSQRRVLLGRRTDGESSWVFPGGKIEPGEDAEAAVREVVEETGLSIHTAGVIGSREHPATGVPITYIAAVPASSQETISPGRELTELQLSTDLPLQKYGLVLHPAPGALGLSSSTFHNRSKRVAANTRLS